MTDENTTTETQASDPLASLPQPDASTTEGTPAAPEPAAEGGESAPAPTPNLTSELAALEQRLITRLGGQQEPAAETDDDLYELLNPPAAEPQGRAQSDPAQGGREYPDWAYEDEADDGPDAMAQIDAIVRERVTEAMMPTLQGIEADRRRDALGALAEKHEELRSPEVQAAIKARLAPLAEAYGNPYLATDPRLVEAMYLAERATKLAAQGVSPAEAAGQGAHVEAAQGASAPTQEDPDEQFKREFLATRGGGVID